MKKIIIILIVINIILLIRFIQLPKLENNTASQSNVHNCLSSIAVQTSLEETYKINGKIFPKIELTNIFNKEKDLSDFIIGKKTLMLIYSDVSCNICLDSLVLNCNKIYSNFNNIIGITYSKRKNYLRRFARINEIKFPLFWKESIL